MNDMDLQVRWDGIERRQRCIDGPFRSKLQAWAEECPEVVGALTVIAKAELYDPSTGIIDADVLEVVQEVARDLLQRMSPP